MDNGRPLYSLIPLADFKAVLGVDDREDALSRYCLVTATYTIEQYCKRRLLRKKRFEFLPFYGDYIFPLRDYPVREILEVCQTHALKEASIVEPGLYHTIPDYGELEDIPFCLSVSPTIRLVRELIALKVHYRAGYVPGKVPADLVSACLELAVGGLKLLFSIEIFLAPRHVTLFIHTLDISRALSGGNLARYRGSSLRSRFLIGMTGNLRGNGKDGEHLEASMPENVKGLLEPYRRRMI
jgi:hypothetical protein